MLDRIVQVAIPSQSAEASPPSGRTHLGTKPEVLSRGRAIHVRESPERMQLAQYKMNWMGGLFPVWVRISLLLTTRADRLKLAGAPRRRH